MEVDIVIHLVMVNLLLKDSAQTTSEVFQGGYTGNTETSKIYADGKAFF